MCFVMFVVILRPNSFWVVAPALQAAQQRASKLAIENASLKRSAMQKAEILAMSRNLLNQVVSIPEHSKSSLRK